MPSGPAEPVLYKVLGGVLFLSGPAFKELLQAVLARGAPLRFKARGFSMHPFIQDGDVILVSSPRVFEPRSGDVAAFCHPQTGKLVVHRVIARLPGEVLLRGDNAAVVDGWVPAGNILGLVTGVQRHGRQVRLGMGPERRLIAWLACRDLLQPLIYKGSRLLGPLVKWFRHG